MSKCLHSTRPSDLTHQPLVNSSPSFFYLTRTPFHLLVRLPLPLGWELLEGKGLFHFLQALTASHKGLHGL